MRCRRSESAYLLISRTFRWRANAIVCWPAYACSSRSKTSKGRWKKRANWRARCPASSIIFTSDRVRLPKFATTMELESLDPRDAIKLFSYVTGELVDDDHIAGQLGGNLSRRRLKSSLRPRLKMRRPRDVGLSGPHKHVWQIAGNRASLEMRVLAVFVAFGGGPLDAAFARDMIGFPPEPIFSGWSGAACWTATASATSCVAGCSTFSEKSRASPRRQRAGDVRRVAGNVPHFAPHRRLRRSRQPAAAQLVVHHVAPRRRSGGALAGRCAAVCRAGRISRWRPIRSSRMPVQLEEGSLLRSLGLSPDRHRQFRARRRQRRDLGLPPLAGIAREGQQPDEYRGHRHNLSLVLGVRSTGSPPAAKAIPAPAATRARVGWAVAAVAIFIVGTVAFVLNPFARRPALHRPPDQNSPRVACLAANLAGCPPRQRLPGATFTAASEKR